MLEFEYLLLYSENLPTITISVYCFNIKTKLLRSETDQIGLHLRILLPCPKNVITFH